MDMYRYIEVLEVFAVACYLFRSWHSESHLTRGSLVGILCALLADIVIMRLYGEKPLWMWFALNIPMTVAIYEKVTRKYVLSVYKRLSVLLLMFLGD